MGDTAKPTTNGDLERRATISGPTQDSIDNATPKGFAIQPQDLATYSDGSTESTPCAAENANVFTLYLTLGREMADAEWLGDFETIWDAVYAARACRLLADCLARPSQQEPRP